MNNLIKHEEKQSLFPTSFFGRQIDHLFGKIFPDFDRNFFHHHMKEIRVNTAEDDKAYYIEAELAGFKKENIKLDYKYNVLSIEAKEEEKKEESKKNYYFVECHKGSFFRSFQLPENVDTKKIDAEMKDGLLKITLPKSEEKSSTATSVNIR